MRRRFVEQDVVDGVDYMPENLFYNTTAPGIILFLLLMGFPEPREAAPVSGKELVPPLLWFVFVR